LREFPWPGFPELGVGAQGCFGQPDIVRC